MGPYHCDAEGTPGASVPSSPPPLCARGALRQDGASLFVHALLVLQGALLRGDPARRGPLCVIALEVETTDDERRSRANDTARCFLPLLYASLVWGVILKPLDT